MPDGQTLCSDTHPIGSGVVSNKIEADSLSLESLREAFTTMKCLKDYDGMPSLAKPTAILVHPKNFFRALDLVHNHPYFSSLKVVENFYLENENSWFLLSDYGNGFIYQDREDLHFSVNINQFDHNISVSAIKRGGYAIPNFRSVVGCQSV